MASLEVLLLLLVFHIILIFTIIIAILITMIIPHLNEYPVDFSDVCVSIGRAAQHQRNDNCIERFIGKFFERIQVANTHVVSLFTDASQRSVLTDDRLLAICNSNYLMAGNSCGGPQNEMNVMR